MQPRRSHKGRAGVRDWHPVEMCTTDDMLVEIAKRHGRCLIVYERPSREMGATERSIRFCGDAVAMIGLAEYAKFRMLNIASGQEGDDDDDDTSDVSD